MALKTGSMYQSVTTNMLKPPNAGAHAYRSFQQNLASSAILILGYPRSGTTWLAKIFDSHPDVLYRHEPDELTLPRAEVEPVEQVGDWIAQRGLRCAGKRPVFNKSWRPVPLAMARHALTLALAGMERLPIRLLAKQNFSLPDLIMLGRRKTVRAVIKLVNWDGGTAAHAMPNSRCCFILRHPCGQIASVKTGLESGKFQLSSESSAPSNMKSTKLFAERHGVNAAAFEALSDAAKFAWSWRAFNETAVEKLELLPNAKILVYEDLCQEPEAVSKELFEFTGLSWNEQTLSFIKQSTSQAESSGYFDVFRKTPVVAEQWRQTLSKQDQADVYAVVHGSPLARFWPDLHRQH